MRETIEQGVRKWAWFLSILLAMTFSMAAVVWAQQDGSDPEQAQADADDLREAAEEHYRMAVQFYGQGRYRESVEEFDRSLDLYDDPVVHCNRAVPLIKLEELRQARQSLLACRDGFDEDSEDRAQVDAQAEALRVIIESVRPTSVEIAREIAMGPAERPDETLDRAPPIYLPSPPVAQERTNRVAVTGLIFLGAGAALGGAAAIVDFQSADMVAAYREESQGGEGTSAQRHDELRQQIETRQRIFWGLAGAGASTAVLGVGLLSWGLLRGSGDSGAYMHISGDGLEAGWLLRF